MEAPQGVDGPVVILFIDITLTELAVGLVWDWVWRRLDMASLGDLVLMVRFVVLFTTALCL